MGFKTKLQIHFIESSLVFIPTEHLYTIQSIVSEDLSNPDNKKVYDIVSKHIEDRKNGKLFKTFKKFKDGVKEVWIEKTEK